jgi:hypothetical protein
MFDMYFQISNIINNAINNNIENNIYTKFSPINILFNNEKNLNKVYSK